MVTDEDTVERVPFSSIHWDEEENAPRRSQKSIEELAKIIKASGWIDPLVVVKLAPGSIPGKLYRLRAGYRRSGALKYLRWGDKLVPVTIRGSEDDPLINLTENSGREDPHPLDLAKALTGLNRGKYAAPQGVAIRVYSIQELADATGRSPVAVRNIIRVDTKLADSVKKKARTIAKISLRALVTCAGFGRYIEVADAEEEDDSGDESGEKRSGEKKRWEPHESKQLAFVEKWADKHKALDQMGKKKKAAANGVAEPPPSSAQEVESGTSDAYGYAKEKVRGKKNLVMLDAMIRVLQSRKDDPVSKGKAEALRFARGEITKLSGVTKSELLAEIELLKAQKHGEEHELEIEEEAATA